MNIENEMGVIVAFSRTCQEAGWEIISIQPGFPDCIIKNTATGETFKAEFEYNAKSFSVHGHSLFGCDLIICWINDWPDCPMTVWELSGSEWATIEIRRLSLIEKENIYLRMENAKLKAQIEELEEVSSSDENIYIDPERRERIRRLLRQKTPISQIVKEEWGASGGNAYQRATGELSEIIAGLVGG